MMSERIKELAEQAGFEFEEFIEGWIAEDEHFERFAELIRQDEREACGNVADEFDDDVGQAISRAIRARGEK